MENINLKRGDMVRVFDYGNEIFDEIVIIILNDGEKILFSGQGYFE